MKLRAMRRGEARQVYDLLEPVFGKKDAPLVRFSAQEQSRSIVRGTTLIEGAVADLAFDAAAVGELAAFPADVPAHLVGLTQFAGVSLHLA